MAESRAFGYAHGVGSLEHGCALDLTRANNNKEPDMGKRLYVGNLSFRSLKLI